jgi:signal peptidase I
MTALQPLARPRSRTIVERVVYLLAALLLLQTWFIDGLAVPCTVTSGSMALTLLGTHREMVCADCGFTFSCDAAMQPVSPMAVCPNCGYEKNDFGVLPDLNGDCVLIDRSAFHFRLPRRWEIVAFRRVQEAGKILIKRVVGLPGETVQISEGDVYINRHMQRKTLDQQREMAVLVYDANYSPAITPVPMPRWQGEKEDSRWSRVDGRFEHPMTAYNRGRVSIDWMEYHHWHRLPEEHGGVQECPISDIMNYNQGLPRREEDVHAVNDLLLSFRLASIEGDGMLYIRAVLGKELFVIEIDPNGRRYRVMRHGQEISWGECRLPARIEGMEIVVSLIDQQLILAFDNRMVLCQPLYGLISPIESTSRPFAIGLKGLELVLDNLRVYRDVYYTHPIGFRGRWGVDKEIRLGEKEYFVLGDNSSVAEDSRTWPERPAVIDKLLIGKPLMIILSAKSASLGKWEFQVPDLSRIRYIR